MSRLPASPTAIETHRATESWLEANAILVTLGLIGANLVLKLPRIGEQGLWFDEAVTLGQMQGTFDLARSMASDASAPLYGILLYGWSALFGPSLEAARVLSAILSSGTAGSLFLFGHRFLDGRAGLFAALLFTVSRTQLYYAHEARPYALVGLLCVWSFYVFLALLEQPTARRIGAAALLSASLVYAHYVAVFALGAQLLAAFCLVHVRSSAMRAYVTSQVLAAVLFAPCAAYLLLAATPLPMAGWIQPPVPGDILYVLSAFVGGPLLVGLYAAVLAAAFAFAQMGSITFDRDRLTLLGLWILAPLALDYAFSFAVPSFLYRYLLYASLGLFLVTGYALTRFPLPEAGRWAAMAFLLVPAAWGAISDPILRADWRGAAEISIAEAAKGALTIVTPPYQLLPFAYHRSRDAFSDQEEMVAMLSRLGVYALPTLGGVGEALKGKTERVVIVADAGHLPANLDALMARANYAPVRSQDLTGVQVRVYGSEP